MSSARIADHAAVAVSRLPSYEQKGPNWGRLIRALLDGAQTVEDTLDDFIEERSLSTSAGQQLDNLGTVMNLPRAGGQADADYRAALLGRAGSMGSSGTMDQLVDVLGIAVPGFVQILTQEHAPATVEMTAVGPDTLTPQQDADVREIMTRTKAGGVGLILNINEEPLFLWGDSADADVNGDLSPSINGYGDSADADAGGDLDPGEGGGNFARNIL